jgi:hypothetical protein
MSVEHRGRRGVLRAVVAEPLDRVRRRHHRLAEARYIVSHDTRVGDLCGAAKLASHGSHMVDLVMRPMSCDHPCAGSRRSADRAGLMPVLLRSASQDIRAAAGALHEGLQADTLLHRLPNAWRA